MVAANHNAVPTSTALLPKPTHVAIIMDGNNRWAKRRNLSGSAGHKAGVEALRGVLDSCKRHQIDVLTLFAFSSENWRRPRLEVRALMALLMRYLRNEVQELHEDGVQIKFIGRRDRLSQRVVQLMERSEALTADNRRSTLVIAVDYGGRWDIAQATASLASDIQAGRVDADSVDEEMFSGYLATGHLPEPDLCIRTGGDARVSNFLLWQFAYTEFYFTDTLWPDFDRIAFERALVDFGGRDRRFGGRNERVAHVEG